MNLYRLLTMPPAQKQAIVALGPDYIFEDFEHDGTINMRQPGATGDNVYVSVDGTKKRYNMFGRQR